MESISQLEELAVKVYNLLDEKYKVEFVSLTWGCHCSPPTEWYGDVFTAFSKILKNDVIQDDRIKSQMKSVINLFSKYFTA